MPRNLFRKAVAFIDDDNELLEFLKVAVEPCEAEVYGFDSQEKSLRDIEDIYPGVVFIDYQLKDGNGLDLLVKLREILPDSQLIMLTGEGNEEVAVKAMKSGADDYIVKPVDPGKLCRKLDESFNNFFDKIIHLNGRYEYPLDDIAVARYEFLRAAYSGLSKNIKTVCQYFNFSRQDFYNYEKKFKQYGTVGLLKKKYLEKLSSDSYSPRDKAIKISSLESFIDTNDEVQMKMEMFREASITDKTNICDISKKYGFSREGFYQIYRRFKEDGMSALTERKKGRPATKK